MNNKPTNIKKNSGKKILKIALIILFSPIIIILLITLFFQIANPIFDKFDKDKFIKLDTQMQSLYQKIKTASNGVDDWKYMAVCSPNHTGDWATGDYNCVTSISTVKTATSVDVINNLQSKYYPIIDNSATLRAKTELDPELPNDFGKKFVVSSAFKDYYEMKSKAVCRYLIELNQSTRDNSLSYDMNYSYGLNINTGIGITTISLRCEDTARGSWYTHIQSTSTLIPGE
ncbi:MAG: hypothetical protein WCJ36_01060 [Candidatus Saccharibacteria bacterium]